MIARRVLWIGIVAVTALAGVIMIISQTAAHSAAITVPTAAAGANLYREGRIEPLVTPQAPAIVDPEPEPASRPPVPHRWGMGESGSTVHSFMLPHNGTGRVIMEATAGDVVIAISILILTAVNLVGMVINND